MKTFVVQMQFVAFLITQLLALAQLAFRVIRPPSKGAFGYRVVVEVFTTALIITFAYRGSVKLSAKITVVAQKVNAAVKEFALKFATETATVCPVNFASTAIVKLDVHRTLAVTPMKFALITSAGTL